MSFQSNEHYVTANEYAKTHNIGVEEVKRLVRTKQLEGFITEGGHYKVLVRNNNSVSREKYEELLKENAQLKTTLNGIKSLIAI